uniref:Uncharacterized protein n=1 Tax=Oryza glumipatula TaxID=40148 RepID=A0A0E0A041_9ORYZ
MAPAAVAAAEAGSKVAGGGGEVVAAWERDAEKLEFIEEMTRGFYAVQERVLAAILVRNNSTEYLRHHGMEGRTDREAFKARVPIVTYEDLRPEIERIANGDRSNIISSHPITEFLTRSCSAASRIASWGRRKRRAAGGGQRLSLPSSPAATFFSLRKNVSAPTQKAKYLL